MFSKMLHFFLPLLLLLTTLTSRGRSLPWDPDHHPDHPGWRHPKNYIGNHLPDYPPNLPDWISSSLKCKDPDIFWDAPKINVLYVAAHFCNYVSVPEAFHLPLRYSRELQRNIASISLSRDLFDTRMETLTSTSSTDCTPAYLRTAAHGSPDEGLRYLLVLQTE